MTHPGARSRVAELRHELRTPVNLILGYSEMLLEDVAPDDAAAGHLRSACDAAREVLDLINTMLPGTDDAKLEDAPELLRRLAEPQGRVLAAVRDAERVMSADAHADLEKIRVAAERLTRVPLPTGTRWPPLSSAVPEGTPAGGVPIISPSAGGKAALEPARILVVDDQEENRMVLARRLSRDGHHVEVAEHGRVALEKLASMPFDLVLLDVIMPEVDGFEVLARMRGDAKLKQLPVIMISALDDIASVVRCIEYGAEDYLAKPFDPVLLRARIGAALDKKRFHDREADYLRLVERVIAAAAAVESGGYSFAMLSEVARRDDELGRLARVFDSMVANAREREDRLHQQLEELRDEVGEAARSITHEELAEPVGTLAPGELFAGRFEVASVLGVGGMGMVYRAHDRELGEDVALKMLRVDITGDDAEALTRFKEEIRLARRISHRNVVRTHDFWESDGAYCVTMEYVAGITVRELLTTRGRLTVSSALGLARQLVEALAVAHEAGIIHRDVKPENALVDQAGVLKVMDFGIARLAERTSHLTQAGMLLGTPSYMAPEQIVGEEVDARADLYAVGVVLYECLTGAVPFTAPSAMALIAKVLTAQPAAPATVVPEIPPALSAVVMRLLEKERAARPASARELLGQLLEIG